MSKLLVIGGVVAWFLAIGIYAVSETVKDVHRLREAVKQLNEKHQEELKARGKLAMESGYSQGVHDTALAAQQYIVESCHSRNHELVAAAQTFICQPKQGI